MRAEHIRIQLANHYRVLGAKTPAQLEPFSLDERAMGGDQQVLSMSVQVPVLTGRYFEGREQVVQAQVNAHWFCFCKDLCVCINAIHCSII